MTGIDSLNKIEDKSSVENIQQIAEAFVDKVKPLKIVLFGSFAKGTYTKDSDFDFYLVVEDGRDVKETMVQARRAVLNIKKRPIDVLVGTNSRFERKRNASYSQMVEREVEQDGIVIYERE